MEWGRGLDEIGRRIVVGYRAYFEWFSCWKERKDNISYVALFTIDLVKVAGIFIALAWLLLITRGMCCAVTSPASCLLLLPVVF